MTTVNTVEDFLRIVREDEEIRAAPRRELPTEELLALPLQVSALTKSIEMYKEATNQQLSIIVNRLDRQHGIYRRQHDDLARFRGNYAIAAARENDVAIARLFARLRGLRRIYVRPLANDELRETLAKSASALEEINLRDEAWDTFVRPDLVAEVTELHSGENPQYYIAVEASFTGHVKDVDRATDHARILRCATGQDAYAVVAAVRMDPNIENRLFDDAAKFLDANDEDAALWYPLVEENPGPPDPC